MSYKNDCLCTSVMHTVFHQLIHPVYHDTSYIYVPLKPMAIRLLTVQHLTDELGCSQLNCRKIYILFLNATSHPGARDPSL